VSRNNARGDRIDAVTIWESMSDRQRCFVCRMATPTYFKFLINCNQLRGIGDLAFFTVVKQDKNR